jgi:Contractile injection system tube protein
MPSGFSNQAKILRGAFVEFGISLPPLIVVFQFNPLTITRTRTASVSQPETPGKNRASNEDFIKQISADKLFKNLRNGQILTVKQQTLSFDIRLDATDKLNDGDTITEQFGVAPQLSTLELMMLPKSQSLLGGAVAALLGGSTNSFSFADDAKNPPVILFIWGRKKVMPVNITNMTIKEEEFSVDLNPIRATVTVSLEVIEGPNAPFLYTKALTEVMSLLNLANIGDIANTIVPA